MGSASTRAKSPVSTKEVFQNKSCRDSNNQRPIDKSQEPSEHPDTMAEGGEAQPPDIPLLPPVGKTPKGDLIPQPPPVQEDIDGYETVHALYNLLNDGFKLPFIQAPEYMLILDTREENQFAESHLLTARPHTAIDTDPEFSPEAGKLKKFHHIVLYDDGSTVEKTSMVLQSLADRLRGQELDPVILIGGFSSFHASFPFLCNDKLIYTERDRAREIRTYPSEVIEGALYQGSAKHACSRAVVENLGITHILNVTKECGNDFEGQCKYMQLKYNDELASNMKHRLPAAADFIASALRDGGRVLVHCVEGISRSSTVTLSFLMKYRGWTLADGLAFLRSKRPKARPNRAFLIQLGDLERDFFGKKISDVEEIWMS